MANPNSRARSWVLQFLYGWEAREAQSLNAYAEAAMKKRRVGERYLPYIKRLLTVLGDDMMGIDARLQLSMPNWRISRLGVIDRSILRIAVAELMVFDDIPPRVSIHEAIRLAERYGSEESPRFVNGVLDAVYHGSVAVN